MRFSEPIEEPGFFWLPEDAENKVPGILRISELGEVTLKISYIYDLSLRTLNKQPLGYPPPRAGDLNIKRIVGIIGNELITLDGCFYTTWNTGLSGGVSTSTIQAMYAFIRPNHNEGEEVTFFEKEEITFSRVDFSVEYLDDWLAVSGFKEEVHWEKDSGLKDTSIHFTPPKEIAFDLPDGIKLKFIFSWTTPFLGIGTTEASITQKAYISLSSRELRSIEYFRSLVFRLHNFLRFVIDEFVSIDSVTGYSSEITKEYERGKRYEIPIKIYYQDTLYSKEKPEIFWNRMLFLYRDVTNQFEKIIMKWVESYKIYESAFNLYFASKDDVHNYTESNFLFLVQGMEALHRKMSQETQMPEEEFGKLVEDILEATPDKKKKWIREKLKYANEISFRKRIKLLIDPFRYFFNTKKEREHFVNKITDTRNYLTHYDSKLMTKAAEAEDLCSLCFKLEALFQLHLLQIIGMDLEFIKSIVNKNYALRNKLGLEYQECSEESA